VITPGETIMLIVPDHDLLSVEAKVSPSDVDQLYPDQPSMLRFSAFDIRTTPELNGRVSWVSPDISEDDRTGTSYYTVRIAVSNSELAKLKNLKVIPGMPVEAFIETGSRTALSYFLKPLADQAKRTFRAS
jgi:HlyD family secretion protein